MAEQQVQPSVSPPKSHHFQLFNLIRGAIIPANDKLVLYSLLGYADPDGTCWPSLGTLAAASSLSRRSVIRHLDRLSKSGILSWDKRSDNESNGTKSNLYRMSADGLRRIQGPTQVSQCHPPGDSQSPPGVPDSHPPGVTVSPEHPNRTDQEEQPIEQKSEPTRNGRAATTKGTYSDAFQSWWEKYPRRIGKKAASDAYSRAAKRIEADQDCSLDEARSFLCDRAEVFAKSPAGQRGTYTPHPTTWLNRGSYDDDPSEWEAKQSDNGRTKSARACDIGGGFLYDPDEPGGGF